MKIGKIQKICPENISYEEVVNVWENCNKERIQLQKENIRLREDSKHWRREAEKFERLFHSKQKVEIKSWCFFCGYKPNAKCYEKHKECIEEDFDSFCERWAIGILGEDEYNRRMKEGAR
jgi:hypothetical protein